jgi:transcriptional regulator with XRE-family HTH domain
MTIVSVPFGQLLYEKIHASGMSAPEFAERVGVAKSTVSKVKSGRILPNPETINKWITQLKLTDIEAAEFRHAAALAHIPEELRRAIDLRKSAESFLSDGRTARYTLLRGALAAKGYATEHAACDAGLFSLTAFSRTYRDPATNLDDAQAVAKALGITLELLLSVPHTVPPEPTRGTP